MSKKSVNKHSKVARFFVSSYPCLWKPYAIEKICYKYRTILELYGTINIGIRKIQKLNFLGLILLLVTWCIKVDKI